MLYSLFIELFTYYELFVFSVNLNYQQVFIVMQSMLQIRKKILIALLLGNLLFGQVAIPFFHSQHKEHSSLKDIPKGENAITPHGEHCLVCSIDLVHGFIYQDSDFLSPQTQLANYSLSSEVSQSLVWLSYAQGRAPPLV